MDADTQTIRNAPRSHADMADEEMLEVAANRSMQRIESSFEAWARLMIRFRFSAFSLSLAFSLACMSALPGLQMDNSIEGFLHEDSPIVVKFDAFRAQFDRDDRILILVKPPRVFDIAFLAKLRALQDDIESELPYIEETTSLLNARLTRGEGDLLIVEDLVETLPSSEAELAALRDRVRANPLYVNNLISEDESLTALSIKPYTYSTLSGDVGLESDLAGFDDAAPGTTAPVLTMRENDELLAALHALVDRYRAPDFQIHLGGALVLTDAINRGLEHDIGVFIPLMFVVIGVFLWILFRRITGVVVPVLVVFLSLLTALGIMVMLELPGSTVGQILPIFLLTVGVCDAVHILTLVYQNLAAGESKHDAIAHAFAHSGLAVLMTSITTAAGMASFMTAELAPIADLGVIAPIGVMLALVYTLIMIPSLLAILPISATPRLAAQRQDGALARVLMAIGDYSNRNPWRILAAAGFVIVVSLIGATRIQVSHDPLAWFPDGDPVRTDFDVINEGLKGAVSMEVLIDTGRENGLHDPEVLRRIDAAQQFAASHSVGAVSVGKATSIVDVIKEIHRALNEDRPEFYAIPDDPKLIAQELILFEQSGSDDLEEIVDSQFRVARLSLRVPWGDALLYPPFLREMGREIANIMGDKATIETTGLLAVLSQVISAVLVSMGRSYFFAIAIISPMMMLLLRSVRRGLLSMIPNLIPVVFTLGVMGFFGISLDSTLMMIGAMIIGIAVDDTIHFMHKFQRYWEDGLETPEAVAKTLATTGSAMLVTTLVLAAGFFTLGFATFANTRMFGILAGSATIVAFVSDVFVAPALMTILTRNQVRESAGVGESEAAWTSGESSELAAGS